MASTPKSNTRFWMEKFKRNVARDVVVKSALRKLGWRVMTVWECELATERKASSIARRVAGRIRKIDGEVSGKH